MPFDGVCVNVRLCVYVGRGVSVLGSVCCMSVFACDVYVCTSINVCVCVSLRVKREVTTVCVCGMCGMQLFVCGMCLCVHVCLY